MKHIINCHTACLAAVLIPIVLNAADKSVQLPDYVNQEKGRVLSELKQKAGAGVAVVAFNTDQHFDTDTKFSSSDKSRYNPKWALQGLYALRQISSEFPLDLIVLGGDVAGYGGGDSKSVDGIKGEVRLLLSSLEGVKCPLISIPGNHDAVQNCKTMTSADMYDVHSAFNRKSRKIVQNGTDNCDCRYDDRKHRIRFICLDTYTKTGRSEKYRDFLEASLSGMPKGWQAMIFSHNPLTKEFEGKIMKNRSNKPGELVRAFGNPADCSAILNRYADRIIACVCGHSHVDACGVSDSGILYIETLCACPHTRSAVQGAELGKAVLGTSSDTAYDIFLIDRNAGTLEAVRYGAGSGRKWQYKAGR